MDVMEWGKAHPALAIGGVVILGLGLFLLLRGGGGSSAATSGTDPNALAYQQSVNAQSAAASSQASSQSFQLAGAQLTAQAQLAQLIESDATNIHLSDTAASVANNANSFNLQATLAGLDTQLKGLESNNATSTGIANITANENLGIAKINGDVAATGIIKNADVSIVQANDWLQAQLAIQKTAQKSSSNNLFSSIVGGVLGAFF